MSDHGVREINTGKLAVIAVSMVSATFFAAEALAQPAKPVEARNVVLVHGAWADGSVGPRSSPAFRRLACVSLPCRIH
jgi:allantoicase